jgi:glycosyltransferase involved in cell wall biosynthesis
MKVLFVTTISTTLRAFLLPFATHFRQKGWRVDAMASGASDCPDCRAAFDNTFEVQWTRNPLNFTNLLKAPRQIRSVVENGGYDIVHVHTPIAAFVTRAALRTMRKTGRPKVIYTAHGFHFHPGGTFLKNTIFRALEKFAGRWTDYLVLINREDERAAREHRIVSPDRVVFIPGIGIDLSHYDPARISPREIDAVRSELKLSTSAPLFLMIASFDPGKRHRDVLRAFAQCNNKEVHLAFAGVGPLFSAMQTLAQALEVGDRVHFLGLRKDVPALIRASVATVLPSEREGLARCVMESLCLEVPVIGSDARGVSDLIDENCGWITPVGNPAALARAMDSILSRPDHAAMLGHNGRAKMADYDINRILKLHEELYAKVIKA